MEALREPMPHQRAALSYAHGRTFIGLLMQMRLGKSLVFIRWAKSCAVDPKVLIVAPLIVLHDWIDELKKEGVEITPLVGPTKKKLAALKSAKSWCFINYEGLRACPEIACHGWDVIGLDESTAIRSPKAQITKLALNLLAHIPNRAILAGEPHPEGLLDFFCQMAFLRGGSFMRERNFYNWRNRYFSLDDYDWTPNPRAREKILEAVAKDCFLLRAKDVGMTNPRIVQRRFCPMPPELRRRYRNCGSKFSTETKETKWTVVVENWLAQLCGGHVPGTDGKQFFPFKAAAIKSLLSTELAGQQAVIWFSFVKEIRSVQKYLEAAGFSCSVIYGLIPPRKRQEELDKFRTGKTRLILLQSGCARFGLDLSVADVAMYYSAPWSWLTRSQTEYRIVHPKKLERPLLYIDFIAEHTVEEAVDIAISEATQEKRTNSANDLKRIRQIILERNLV